MSTQVAAPFSLFGQPVNRCYVDVVDGLKSVTLKATIITTTKEGHYIETEWQGQRFGFYHAFKIKDGTLDANGNRYIWGRPHYQIPIGSSIDTDWVTGQPTGDVAVLSKLVRSKIATEVINSVKRSKGDMNLKSFAVIILVLIVLGGIGVAVYKNLNKTPVENTTPPITSISPYTTTAAK